MYDDFTNFKNDLNEGDVAIISSFNGSVNNGNQFDINGMSIHTYAIQVSNNNNITTYNRASDKTPVNDVDVDSLITNDEYFLVGYILKNN